MLNSIEKRGKIDAEFGAPFFLFTLYHLKKEVQFGYTDQHIKRL